MNTASQIVEASKAKFGTLESKLAGTLTPVAPRREFVHGLGSRIKRNTQSPAVVNRLVGAQSALILIAGLVSVGVLVALGMRALFALFVRKSTVRV